MKLPDGTPIAADLQADWERLGGHRCNDHKCPIMVRLAVIERISRSEERERVLLEALDKIHLFAVHGCGTKQKDVRGRQFSAIDELALAALATPAPEPAQPSAENGSSK